jgi:hypothetical protein
MSLKRIEDYNKILPVLELYRCVQSEGSRFGRPTIAVRTTGCTHRCYFGEGGGVTAGILPSTQKKVDSHSTTLSKSMMRILTLKR